MTTEVQSTELVVAGKTLTPALVFNADGGVDAALDAIKKEVRATKADVSTSAGRQVIRSVAYKIARSKTLLDSMGKDLVAGLKAQSGAIDAERRRIRDELDKLADEFRRPLTDFENAEKARVASHEAALSELQALASIDRVPKTADGLAAHIALARAYGDNRDWQEFIGRFAEIREHVIAALEALHARLVEEEAAEAERERFRQEETARRQRERDAQVRAAAAEQAKREAEAKAAAEARAAEERALREREAIEARARQEREAAEARANAEREARERAERETAAAEARARQAEQQRVAAEQRTKQEAEAAARRAEDERRAAAEREERARQKAVADERRRAEAERQREAEEAQRREADRRHRGKVNGAARDALVKEGLSEPAATAAITAIARGAIPNVRIAY